MTPYENRLLELVDRAQQALDEIRAHVKRGPGVSPAPDGESPEVTAFADETFRARDA